MLWCHDYALGIKPPHYFRWNFRRTAQRNPLFNLQGSPAVRVQFSVRPMPFDQCPIPLHAN